MKHVSSSLNSNKELNLNKINKNYDSLRKVGKCKFNVKTFRKMARTARKFVRVTKFLLAGVTIFCVSWIACVSEWHAGVRWRERRAGYSTMRTIVAYSEGKQAEMDRPSPVACDRLPAFPAVPHMDRSWQPNTQSSWKWQKVYGTVVSLYAAYYDDRSAQPYVRILASFKGRKFSPDERLYCQTRYLSPYEESVEVVAAKPLEIWWDGWDKISKNVDTPLLLSCPLTESINESSIVSVVTEPCANPTNAFIIEPSQPNHKYERLFTICVKDMTFEKDISQNLIEWIETNKILGVDKIDIYVDKITKESEDVLQYYRTRGFVRLFHVPINDSPGRSLWQRRRDHIITFNDCLYRNIQESEYIVPLDIDEIVLPKIANTWPELLNRLFEKGWNPSKNFAINIRNAFFFDFLQGIDQYEPKKQFASNKLYIKRDDVRISTLNITEIELVDKTDSINEVIDINDDHSIRKLEEAYKSRCGREMIVPKLARNIIRSAWVSPVGYYCKSLMVTKNVLTAFNHYPLNSIIRTAPFAAGWPAPLSEVQLNHYKESCNTMLMAAECARYGRRARVDRSALRLRTNLTRALAAGYCAPINTT